MYSLVTSQFGLVVTFKNGQSFLSTEVNDAAQFETKKAATDAKKILKAKFGYKLVVTKA